MNNVAQKTPGSPRRAKQETSRSVGATKLAPPAAHADPSADEPCTDYTGTHAITLREAADAAIRDIEGIVEEAREGLDQAAAMFVYVSGQCTGDCGRWDARPDVAVRFNDGMATAAGALSCLLSYLDPLRRRTAASSGRGSERSSLVEADAPSSEVKSAQGESTYLDTCLDDAQVALGRMMAIVSIIEIDGHLEGVEGGYASFRDLAGKLVTSIGTAREASIRSQARQARDLDAAAEE